MSTTGTPHTFGAPSVQLPPNTVLLSQGAEARVYTGTWVDREAIIKERFVKAYRHPVLDKKITAKRIVQEAKSMCRCMSLGIEVPTVFFVDPEHTQRIYMERVHGCTVKEFLLKADTNENDALQLATLIGTTIARLHDAHLVHGDLTTSNMLLRNGNREHLVMIDFGLSYTTSFHEDMAVDLYVLERAILSTHPNAKKIFRALLHGYEVTGKKAKQVLAKLIQVRLRGRKRDMIG